MYSFGDYDDCNHALDNGYIHEDDLPDFETAREFLVGIQECVYLTGNVEKLENNLEELCSLLDCIVIDAAKGKPRLKQAPDYMQWYLGYQRTRMNQNINTIKENSNV